MYVTGYSNATWNAGATAPLNAYSGDYDIVVLKLNTAGPTSGIHFTALPVVMMKARASQWTRLQCM